jgi:apolipoprotein N-acyltransferase
VHVRFGFGHSIRGAFASATLFTVLINYIPHILPGNLAHALYLRPHFIQLADLGGVALVFFLLHCINILIANSITLISVNRSKAMYYFIVAALLFIGNMSYGYFKEELLHNEFSTKEQSIRVAFIQPNIDISNRTRDDWLDYQEQLTALFLKVKEEQSVDLVVLPEVPVPISYRYYEKDKKFFDKNLTEYPLILTAISPVGETINETSGYFNTMEFIEDKSVTQNYTKQVLLPFGEYLPFEQELPWLRELFPFAPNYKPGKQATLFTVKNSLGISFKAIPLICYEAIFPELVASGVSKGGQFIINSSNDAWFNHASGKRVHLALSLFRSIENRKYLVRVTNTGLSGVIDPFGRFVKGSQILKNTQGYSVVELFISDQTSFYQQNPNAIKILFLISILFIFIYFRPIYVDNKYTS